MTKRLMLVAAGIVTVGITLWARHGGIDPNEATAAVLASTPALVAASGRVESVGEERAIGTDVVARLVHVLVDEGEAVDAAPEWERLAPVHLQTVCMRHSPAAMAGDEARLGPHNLAIARKINESGAAYLTPAVLKGRQMIRVSIGAETTERRDVEALWERLREAASGG